MLILTATAQKTNFLISYMQVKLVLEILEIFWQHGSKSMVRFSSMMSSLMRVWWLMINGSIKKPTERQLQHICSSHKMCEASAIKTLVSSPFCCEDDMLVMISNWIDKGWSRLWRFILLPGLCGSKAQTGIIFIPHKVWLHLSRSKTASGNMGLSKTRLQS